MSFSRKVLIFVMDTGHKITRLTPSKIISAGFLLLILIGGFLLSLPISSKSGEFTPLLDSIFTATSATCVTGLVVYDTYTHWTLFGQIVILFLIQIGGLGFMTIGALVSLMLGRTISLKERLIMSEALNQNGVAGIVRMTKHIIFGTFLFEGVGALALSFVFIPQFGFGNGLFKSIFHAISSFCNAGFDLMGEQEAFSSLTSYVGNPIINITIMALIVIGGLGFYTWEDVLQKKRFKSLRLHTKLTFIMTAMLLIGGAILYFIFEYNNPFTMRDLSIGEKGLASVFMSVTTRTAGYNTISIADLTPVSKFLTVLLMFIGGSPGSTAGGIKTVTVAVLVIAAFAAIKSNSDVNIFGRRISTGTVFRAITVVTIAIILVVTGTFLVLLAENTSFMDILIEVSSAFATVGLSAGLTPSLSFISKIVLIFIMYAGRVGVTTFLIALVLRGSGAKPIRYPEEKVIVG